MGKTLVISEKPSVAKEIANVLDDSFVREDGYMEGDDYIITWAFGHLLSLAEPEVYDEALKSWKMSDLPFIPTSFKLKARDSDARTHLKKIKTLIDRKDVDGVVNACDAGREGELIFAYIWQTMKGKQPVKRLWISSLTAQAIKKGFTTLKDETEMKDLEDAARARSESDWIVGMNATRAATIKCRQAVDGVVSLGRVQTPTLALIVRRELEIQSFVPETFFNVRAQFLADSGGEYPGTWFSGKETKIDDKEKAELLKVKVEGKTGEITSVETKEAREKAPLLYDLTTLQREANKRFGLSADDTLKAAQALYETHKALTYPRTSARYLSTDMAADLPTVVKRLESVADYQAPAAYVSSLKELPLKRVIDDAKVTDHHAIIPTDIAYPFGNMSPDEEKIFDMVARRFLAVFHPDAVFEQTQIITTVEAETFRTRGKVLVEAGWRSAYGAQDVEDKEDKKSEEDESSVSLPKVIQGEKSKCLKAEVQEKQTKAPPRYNDASLLGAMETAGRAIDDEELREAMKESGLGTPATRAAMIETLIRRGYVGRKKKDLVPSPKGIEVIKLLGDHMITSAELTGSWEKRLNEIEAGKGDRASFMADIAGFVGKTVQELAALQVESKPLDPGEYGYCPRCGDKTGAIIRETKKAYSCSSWQSSDDPGCGFTIWKTFFGKAIGKRIASELIKNGKTAAKVEGLKTSNGKVFSSQLVIDPDSGKVTIPRELEIKKSPELGACPFCRFAGKEEKIRETLRNYGCTSWKGSDDPGCGFIIWKEIAGRKIDREIATQLITKGKSDDVLDGFVSKKGNTFSTRLKVDQRNKKITFLFADGPAPPPAAK